MSFSGDIKKELARQIDGARHCRLAELAGILRFSARRPAVRNGSGYRIELQSEQSSTAETCFLLLKYLFGLKPELSIAGSGTHRNCVLRIGDAAESGRVLKAVGLMNSEGELQFGMPFLHRPVLQRDCCRRAFLRGAFLAAGSVSDPKRSYHLEILSGVRTDAEELIRLIATFRIGARVTTRKKYFVVYIKESGDIAAMLGLMGARVGLMDMENVRILKEMRGEVNRKVNCETANINKTVSAAVRQIQDIRLIEKNGGLEQLPDRLDEMAQIRLQYPEASLKELAMLIDPPVSKSAVNHRLRKLSEIAEAIRTSQGG